MLLFGKAAKVIQLLLEFDVISGGFMPVLYWVVVSNLLCFSIDVLFSFLGT